MRDHSARFREHVVKEKLPSLARLRLEFISSWICTSSGILYR